MTTRPRENDDQPKTGCRVTGPWSLPDQLSDRGNTDGSTTGLCCLSPVGYKTGLGPRDRRRGDFIGSEL
jgi:hypothetical protein